MPFSITLWEMFDIIIMTLLLGFLFKGMFRPAHRRSYEEDPVAHYARPRRNHWQDFLFTIGVIAPAVILHELAHKFVAISFGLEATFHAFYANPTTLLIGVIAVIAKLTGFGFVFLVPGFVSIMGEATPAQHAIIAFAGPAIHGLFWIGALLYGKLAKHLTQRQRQFIHLTKYVNGFLFILNMLPIPGIDGYHVYTGLLGAL
ncbi:hypothetical protein JXA12_04475 [Candidatus Woesearchaeota archaeon]|nr:hypothetical protein [Candidatus Woesearchaeota archaeon]